MSSPAEKHNPCWAVPVENDRYLVESGLLAARQLVWVIAGMAIVFVFLGSAQLNAINLALGIALMLMCLVPWVRWFQSPSRPFPYLETICLHLFAVYVPPIFLAPVTFTGFGFTYTLSQSALTQTLWILVGSIATFHLTVMIGRRAIRQRPRQFHLDPHLAPHWALVFLAIAAFGPILVTNVPSALAKLTHLLFQVNAGVSVYVLSAFFHERGLSRWQSITFLSLLSVFILLSLATGWLTFAVFPVYTFLLAEVQLKKSIPWTRIAIAAVAVFAFNATKADFRKIHWNNPMGGEPVETLSQGYDRAFDWVGLTLSDDYDLTEASRETALQRLNNLAFLGHVIHWTPARRPHLGWKTYSIVPAMFIPRIIWKGKPTVMEVANDIALRYGMLAEWQIGNVALDVGLIPEGYIAFGILGAFGIMALLGFGVGAISTALGDPHNGFGWMVTLAAILCGGGIMITWPLQNFIGGLWQAVFVCMVLYFPLKLHRRLR